MLGWWPLSIYAHYTHLCKYIYNFFGGSDHNVFTIGEHGKKHDLKNKFYQNVVKIINFYKSYWEL